MKHFLSLLLLLCCLCGTAAAEGTLTPGTQTQRGFINDNVLHSEIGAMNDEYFVQNIGSTLHTYQSVDLELYFANSEGDKLVTETEHVRYNSNTLKEKLIVEELMKGPFAETYKKVIPMDTVLLGVSVKDDVCYVNFDNGFLNMTDIQPEVTIYSIVNSIIRGGSASKVQILVNGDSNLKYQDQVDLSQPLTEREDIVED